MIGVGLNHIQGMLKTGKENILSMSECSALIAVELSKPDECRTKE